MIKDDDKLNELEDDDFEIIDEGDDIGDDDDVEDIEYAEDVDDDDNIEDELDEDMKSYNPEQSDEDVLERKDKVMNVLIAVGATFILMFTTFGILKISSAIKSATILNNTTSVEAETTTEKETTYEVSVGVDEDEKNTFTTIHTTPAIDDGDEDTSQEQSTTEPVSETEPSSDGEPEGGESDLNSASIVPVTTGFAQLDTQVQSVLASASGSQYDRIKSIYTYIVRNFSAGTNDAADATVFTALGDVQYESNSDAYRVYEANQALATNRTDASGYASAFVVLARAAGMNAYYVTGQSTKLGTAHSWAIISIRGKEYIFDPYLEDKYKDNGNISYSYFDKQISELPGMYIYANKSGDIGSYGGFNVVASMTLNVNFDEISGACKWTPSSDKTACINNTKSYISAQVGNSVNISANVPGSGLNMWKVTLVNSDTGEETLLTSQDQGASSFKYSWVPEKAGNYDIVVSATDVLGRCCKVSAQARVIGDTGITGLEVTQKVHKADNEAYLIEAKATDGIGDIQYDFTVYVKNASGKSVLADKSWISWNSTSSIVINIPDGTAKGTQINVKVVAADDANNRVEQEINLTTKGK